MITLFNGGFRRSNLGLDYADFMKRHSNLPTGASDLHMLIATQVIACSIANYDDPKHDEKWDMMYELMRQLEFNDQDEYILVQTMVNLKAKDDEIELAREVYSTEREYVESMRQRELDRIEWERENAKREEIDRLEDEEFEKQMKVEREEFEKEMKEWNESEVSDVE